jgi:hypothetical protein
MQNFWPLFLSQMFILRCVLSGFFCAFLTVLREKLLGIHPKNREGVFFSCLGQTVKRVKSQPLFSE